MLEFSCRVYGVHQVSLTMTMKYQDHSCNSDIDPRLTFVWSTHALTVKLERGLMSPSTASRPGSRVRLRGQFVVALALLRPHNTCGEAALIITLQARCGVALSHLRKWEICPQLSPRKKKNVLELQPEEGEPEVEKGNCVWVESCALRWRFGSLHQAVRSWRVFQGVL